MYPKSIQSLINSFKYFPGVGEKSAERFAFSILNMEQEQVDDLSKNIKEVKQNIKRCKICNNFSENDYCSICEEDNRNKDYLCVIEDPKTLFSIEKIGTYHGYYHVLNGLISSFNNIDTSDVQISNLIKRIQDGNFKEVIIAFKQCIEGEITALYIKKLLSDMDIKVTRIASGIPIGADMEYIDSLTLEKAFDNRQIIS